MGRLSLTVVVLAGGRGARMGGVTKPLLEDREGHTLLERIDRALSGLGAELVAVAPEALVGELARVWPHRVLTDLGLGPGAALVHAARALATEWILLVGGDHDAPSLRLAERLVDAAVAAGEGAEVVRVVGEGGPEPLFALYRRSAVEATCPEGQVPRLPLRAFGAAGATVELALGALSAEEQAALHDVDTTEDAAAAGLERPGAH